MTPFRRILLAALFLASTFLWAPPTQADSSLLRPEEYLPTVEDLPTELLERHAPDTFEIINVGQMSLPNLYRATHALLSTSGANIRCELYVGVPGYWEGFRLIKRHAASITGRPEGSWDVAVQIEGSRQIVRFVKGNVMAEVYQNGGDIEDSLAVARAMANKLPDSLPMPDTWQLELPPVNPDLQLPNKYLFDLTMDEGPDGNPPGTVSMRNPARSMAFTIRYPFARITKAIYDERLERYVSRSCIKSKTQLYIPDFGVYVSDFYDSHNLGVFTSDFADFHPALSTGDYEVRYWVGEVMVARYPFVIVD